MFSARTLTAAPVLATTVSLGLSPFRLRHSPETITRPRQRRVFEVIDDVTIVIENVMSA